MKAIAFVSFFFIGYSITAVEGICRVLTLKGDDGDFLSRIRRGGIDPIESAKKTPDVFCQFKKIQIDKDTVAFQADNGKFLSRIYRNGKHAIEAAKDSIDVFSMFEVGWVNGKVTLQGDNNRYLSRINRGYQYDPIESVKPTADYYSQFQVIGVQPTFQTPHFWSGLVLNPVLILQADNGQYLSRIRRSGGIDPIEAAKSKPDVFCQFKAIRIDEDFYAFQADNGKFLSRIYRGGKHAIEAAKSEIDVYSRFRVSLVRWNKITLQADNGRFWSRINRGGSYNPVESVKQSADIYSQFTMTVVKFV